jgi:P27 family predicted phage terminase small subunit
MIRAPKHLSKEAKQWWRQLYDEYQITDSAGRLILLGLVEAFDRMRKAQEIILAEGEMIKDRFEQMKAHPLITVEKDSRSAVLAGLKALNVDLEPPNSMIGRPPGR